MEDTLLSLCSKNCNSTFLIYSRSIAALFGSGVVDKDTDCRGVDEVGDRGSTKLTFESRGEVGGGRLSIDFSFFNSSERCYSQKNAKTLYCSYPLSSLQLLDTNL